MNKAGKLTAWESFSSEITAETALIVMTVTKLTCSQHIDMHVLGKKGPYYLATQLPSV